MSESEYPGKMSEAEAVELGILEPHDEAAEKRALSEVEQMTARLKAEVDDRTRTLIAQAAKAAADRIFRERSVLPYSPEFNVQNSKHAESLIVEEFARAMSLKVKEVSG